ncbi:MAG TPA: hypothetical protein VJI52_01855 [Candidatus Nanoarchaeia archaeon]|nr:hypothetical protein [Candidatus Nanoarchaeia archaeon]
MKKSLMLLPVILIIIPIAFAESKIHSGNVITDTDLKLAEGTFRFTYDVEGNQTFVMTPTINMIIQTGECKSNGVFKVCINSAEYYDRNITTYITYYTINADIYKETGSLSAASTASLSTLLQKESTPIKIIISNPTDLDVSKISYVEDFYPFAIIDVVGCSIEGTVMKWSGSLRPKYTQTCTATLFAPEQSGINSIVGKLSYYNGFNTETVSTDALSITVLPKQLRIDESSDSKSEMDKPFYINLSLSNINSDQSLDVSVSIYLSNNFAVVKKTAELAKSGNELGYSARMQPGKIVNFSIYLKPTSWGNFSIGKKFTYTIKNIGDVIENATYISVLDPAPAIDLASEYSEISPGQKFIVSAKLTNPSTVYTLEDIQSKLSIPYLNGVSQNLKQLGPNESYTIISNAFILSDGSYPQDYLKINLEVAYTLNDIQRTLNKSIEVKIRQKNEMSNSVLPPNSTASAAQAQAAAQQNQNAAVPQQQTQQSVPPPPPAQVTEDKLNLPKPKLDFSDRRVLIIIGVLFALLFIVPSVIYKIKKNRKQNPPPPFNLPIIPPPAQ